MKKINKIRKTLEEKMKYFVSIFLLILVLFLLHTYIYLPQQIPQTISYTYKDTMNVEMWFNPIPGNDLEHSFTCVGYVGDSLVYQNYISFMDDIFIRETIEEHRERDNNFKIRY